MKATTGPLYERLISLRRHYRRKNRIANGMMDAVPLVDIALLLFGFFVLGSDFVLQPSIEIDLPESPFVSGTAARSMLLVISQEGHYYFNDDRITSSSLSQRLEKAAHDQPDARLLIAADANIDHKMMVDVYNKAMRAGIGKVAIATRVSAGEAVPEDVP